MAQTFSNRVPSSPSNYKANDNLKRLIKKSNFSLTNPGGQNPATVPQSFSATNRLSGNTPTFKPPQQQAPTPGVLPPQNSGSQSMTGGGGGAMGGVPPLMPPPPQQNRPSNQVRNPQMAPQPPQALFPNVLESLRGSSNPGKDQRRAIEEVRNAAMGNKAIADRASALSKEYGDEISRVGGLGAGAVAGNLSTGTSVVGSGNAAIASQSASARMDALAAGQEAALKGTAQELTAQSQTADALNSVLQGANTQQGQRINALSSTAGFAQPVQIAPGNTLSSPTDGATVAGGLGGYVNYQTAQQVMGLISQYPDANYKYDENLTPQQNLQLAQGAIQRSPTYQKSTFGVPGQNSIAGATATQTAQSGYESSYQNYNNIVTMKNQADTLTANLESVMAQYNIGGNDARKINEIFNVVRRQFGSDGQAAFEAALKETQAAYSGLLATGGGLTPTESSATNNILNPNATVSQVIASINELRKAGEARVQTQGQQVNTYWQQLQAANPQGGGGGGGGEWNW